MAETVKTNSEGYHPRSFFVPKKESINLDLKNTVIQDGTVDAAYQAVALDYSSKNI